MTIADSRITGAPAPAARPAPRLPRTPEEREAFLRAESQAQRLRELWSRSRDEARGARPGSPAFSRVADLAASYAAMAIRAGQRQQARAVVGDALVTLRHACMHDRDDPARHLALARTLELAAASEVAAGDARSAFDALRAAIATVAPFAARLRDRATDPLLRMAIASGLARPIGGAARMIEDGAQRRVALEQLWDEARAWAKAASGASDHGAAIEFAVVAAFDLAVEETGESAAGCLERCEELRPHLDALRRLRGDDVAHRTHRAAFCRLTADAWSRLGDRREAEACLTEAEGHLAEAERMSGADLRELSVQRSAIAAQRAALARPEAR